ncbi:hypothetical protein Bca101_027027 [Brassica carinata]
MLILENTLRSWRKFLLKTTNTHTHTHIQRSVFFTEFDSLPLDSLPPLKPLQ